MLKQCDNCGREFLAEADPFYYQSFKNGCEYYSCGCVEKKEAIIDFIKQVEAKAEEKMLKTGKLEGAHYAAMKELAKKL